MGWAAVVKGAVDYLHGYLSGSVQKAQIDANNRLSAAYTEASNKVRGGANAFAAARGALQRYMQSVNNNRILDAGGAALEANLVNARRQDDALQTASFEDQIRDAERTGGQAAAAAFAGVGGSQTSDMVSLSTRLSHERAMAAAASTRGSALYDATRRAGAIHQQMVGQLDGSLIFDNIDYTVDVAQKNKALNPVYVGLMQSVSGLLGTSTLQNYGQNDKPQPSYSWSPNDRGYSPARDSQAAYGSTTNTFSFGTGSGYGEQDIGMFL